MCGSENIAKLLTLCFILCISLMESVNSVPTLEFEPLPRNARSTLIWYRASNKSDTQYWINKLDNFLSAYTTAEKSVNAQSCTQVNKPDEDKFCDFELTKNFAPCTEDYGYGFESTEGGPCIFLKLNKIFGWIPDYYNYTTAPSNMPYNVRQQMFNIEKSGARLVWIDCAGENPADVENVGIINFYPQRGFHEKYFPFRNIKGYLSPLVAVHFENPTRGVLINIRCKAWARNIHHDKGEGSVHFELMIDL